MTTLKTSTWTANIYLSGDIAEASRILQRECFKIGLCVTIEPLDFIYTGGREPGYRVGMVNYPRFPKSQDRLESIAMDLAVVLLNETFQKSALVVAPNGSMWLSNADMVKE